MRSFSDIGAGADNRYGANPSQRIGWRCLPVLILAVALSSCLPARSQSDVVGVYELRQGKQKITLEMLPAGTFTETILFTSGQTAKRTGQWSWASGRVGLEGFWIPRSFAPDYILRADSETGSPSQDWRWRPPFQPKYTDPGYWSVSAERHWGTTTLSIFPDAEVEFRMVKHGSRP
jgi:hypothetical protein